MHNDAFKDDIAQARPTRTPYRTKRRTAANSENLLDGDGGDHANRPQARAARYTIQKASDVQASRTMMLRRINAVCRKGGARRRFDGQPIGSRGLEARWGSDPSLVTSDQIHFPRYNGQDT